MERRKRAVDALEKVDLGNQLHKKPSHDVRVDRCSEWAIARALVNDPDILLADVSRPEHWTVIPAYRVMDLFKGCGEGQVSSHGYP